MGDSAKEILPLVALAGMAIPGLQAAGVIGPILGKAGAAGGGVAAGSHAAYSASLSTPSLLSKAGSWIAANPGTALSGLGTALSSVGSLNAAQAQQNVLKVQQAQDALRLSQAERDTQERLTKTLSRQNNFFAAIGGRSGRRRCVARPTRGGGPGRAGIIRDRHSTPA